MKYCVEITLIVDAQTAEEAEVIAHAVAATAERKDGVREAWMSYLNESRD